MEKYQEILEDAILRCQGNERENNTFLRLYPFTTENISGYIDHFELKDRSLLTVGSSSDQVINAALKGAQDITLLDINPYIRYYYYLKVASILALNINDFYEFLSYYSIKRGVNINVLCKILFERVKPTLYDLDQESYQFWDTLFKEFEPMKVRDGLFNDDEHDKEVIAKFNPYLNGKAYREIRSIIKDVRVTFVNQDAITAKLDRRFHNIWLSNISRWIGVYETRKMFNQMWDMLEEDGQLLLSYIYGPSYNSTSDRNSHLNRMLQEFKGSELEEIKFQGVNSMIESHSMFHTSGCKDSILIIKKH